MLQRRRVENDVRPERGHQPLNPLRVADVGDASFDLHLRAVGRQRLADIVKRLFGMFDNQQPRRAEGRHATADFRADRAAAAGDGNRLAAHQRFQPAIIDADARPQQQILDRDRREPRRLAALVQRRHAVDGQSELARLQQHVFRVQLRHQRRGRHHDPLDRLLAPLEIADDVGEVVETAEHRNAADRLAAIGARRRENADRPDLLHRAALDAADQHFRVRRPAEDQHRRRVGVACRPQRPRVAEIAIGEARPGEERHLQEPVENDRGLAEEERAVHVRREEDVVQHQERDGEHARDADDVEHVGERNEPPFRRRQPERGADDDAQRQKIRQDHRQHRQARQQVQIFEPQIEARQHGGGRRHHVVQRDQIDARAEAEELFHSPPSCARFTSELVLKPGTMSTSNTSPPPASTISRPTTCSRV